MSLEHLVYPTPTQAGSASVHECSLIGGWGTRSAYIILWQGCSMGWRAQVTWRAWASSSWSHPQSSPSLCPPCCPLIQHSHHYLNHRWAMHTKIPARVTSRPLKVSSKPHTHTRTLPYSHCHHFTLNLHPHSQWPPRCKWKSHGPLPTASSGVQ